MRKTVAIDFDGVIHAYTRGWADGSVYDPPMPGAFDAIRRLMRTFSVCVFSCRDPEQIRNWVLEKAPDVCPFVMHPAQRFCNYEGKLGITGLKPVADVYIDDGAIRFTDWPSALASTYLHTHNFDLLQEIIPA
jgi:5'(3')-deoxyribonucleotidase